MSDMLGIQRARAKVLVQRAIDALPEKTDLIYVDYNDQLTEQQVRFHLAGDDESLWESLSNFESESTHQAVLSYLNEALDDPDEVEAVRDDDEAWERFRDECIDRDESDALRDLIRNTPAPMVKYDLDHVVEPNSWSMDDDEITEEMRGIAQAAGIDFEGNRKALRSLVVEASYGGSLHVLHRSDLADLHGAKRAVFTDPFLLVHDTLNGSGDMEEVKGEVTVEIGEDTLRLDAGRMSWSDDIAGIVHSACETPVKYEKDEPT